MKHFLFVFDEKHVATGELALRDLYRCGFIVFVHWIVPSKTSWYVKIEDIDFDLKHFFPCPCSIFEQKKTPKMFQQLPKREGLPFSKVIVVPNMPKHDRKERFRHFVVVIENDDMDLTRCVMRDLVDTGIMRYIRNTVSKSHFYMYNGEKKYTFKKLWSLIKNNHLPFVTIRECKDPVFDEFEDLYEVGVFPTLRNMMSIHFRLHLHDTSMNCVATAWGGFDAVKAAGILEEVKQIGTSKSQYYLRTVGQMKTEELRGILENVFIQNFSLAVIEEKPFIPVLSVFEKTYDNCTSSFFDVGVPISFPNDKTLSVIQGRPLCV